MQRIPEWLLWLVVVTTSIWICLIFYNDERFQVEWPRQDSERDMIPIVSHASANSALETPTACTRDGNGICHKVTNEKVTAQKRGKKRNSRLVDKERQEFMIHQRNTKYLNPVLDVRYVDAAKRHGLFVRSNVKPGEILFVETPMFKIECFERVVRAKRMDEKMVSRTFIEVEKRRWMDPEFSRTWDSLRISPLVFYGASSEFRELDGFDDVRKTASNQFGKVVARKPYAVYALINQITFGLPQNIAVIAGDEGSDFVSIVMATKNIPKDTELCSDYMFDWLSKVIDEPQQYLEMRKAVSKEFGFQHNEEWTHLRDTLNDPTVSNVEKYRIAEEKLYPNGIIGKVMGKPTEIVPGGTAEIARQLKWFVDSGHVFSLLRGAAEEDAPSWTGAHFVEMAKLWRKNNRK